MTVNQTFSNTGPCAVQGQPDGPGPEFEITFPAGVKPVGHADEDHVVASIPAKKGGAEADEAAGEDTAS